MSCASVVVRVLRRSCSWLRPHTMHAGFGRHVVMVDTSFGGCAKKASCKGV